MRNLAKDVLGELWNIQKLAENVPKLATDVCGETKNILNQAGNVYGEIENV